MIAINNPCVGKLLIVRMIPKIIKVKECSVGLAKCPK
ncbi:MAG: hypothetical protein ACI9NN_000475 [Bacteroidia bacterium]